MRFIDLVIRNVVRRKVRSTLTGIGVAVAVATVVTLLGVSTGLQRSASDAYRRHGVDLMVVRAGTAQRTSGSLDARVADRLRELTGVADVTLSLTDVVSLGGGVRGVLVHGWPAECRMHDNLAISEGRRLTADDHGRVLLGSILAHNLNKRVGETLEIELNPFEVAGIFDSSNVFEGGSAVVLLDDLQKLMDQSGQVSEFLVALSSEEARGPDGLERLCGEIKDLRDGNDKPLGLTAMPTEEYAGNSFEVSLARAMAWATSTIALAIGCVGMLNTMAMSVLERTQEIGVLRAIGWRRSRIVRMVLSEACILSLAGAALGSLGAVVLARVLAALPAAQGALDGGTPPSIVALGFMAALVLGLAGGFFPAIRGANLRPTEALRYE
ncbi:MAG TPA: ABC transporter permease [Pirellulales bacterium]|nr:ABC transporter permease [Pirellulales bacterium]